MSFDKDINGYTVKFEDEKSYLNCRIDYINYCEEEDAPTGFEISFLQFIQDEMYFTDTCTVESIEPTQYTSNQVYVGSDTTPIGFALGGGNPSETVSVSSYGTYTTAVDYGAFGTGDVHISGNLIVDGGITWGGGSNFSPGPGNYEQPGAGNPVTFTTHESPKEEPPEDPIDNRFDILDL
jgi:hypothetical protein